MTPPLHIYILPTLIRRPTVPKSIIDQWWQFEAFDAQFNHRYGLPNLPDKYEHELQNNETFLEGYFYLIINIEIS